MPDSCSSIRPSGWPSDCPPSTSSASRPSGWPTQFKPRTGSAMSPLLASLRVATTVGGGKVREPAFSAATKSSSLGNDQISTSPPSCPVAKSRPPPLVPVPPVPPAALDSQQHADTRPASLSSGHKGFLAWAFSEARSFCDLMSHSTSPDCSCIASTRCTPAKEWEASSTSAPAACIWSGVTRNGMSCRLLAVCTSQESMPAAFTNAAARMMPDLQPSSRKGSRGMIAMHRTSSPSGLICAMECTQLSPASVTAPPMLQASRKPASHMRTSAPLFTTNSSCLVPKGFTAALYSVTSHPMRPITFTLPSVVLIAKSFWMGS
mmetsp:Transcript_6499/g.17392  ORF Transcript_6499/g.17392 Transcript_6499/m.17392 type:complete len:320 (+) Transcript_6499:5100-6059(+)